MDSCSTPQAPGPEWDRIDALALLHKGPLFEPNRQFRAGCIFDCSGIDLAGVAIHRVLGRSGAGWWECELADNSLTWTTGVYEIFGLPAASSVTREDAVKLYGEQSRAIMERLRSYAIAHDCGFIVDVEITPATGERRLWMRLIGVPVHEQGRVVRLEGLKIVI